jgi:hypothetical protein
MLIIQKHDLAENLAAYGEIEASTRVSSMSDDEYRRVCEVAFQYLRNRNPLMKSACLAAIEVLEGKPRELKRKKRRWRDVSRTERPPDPIHDAVFARFKRYAGGNRIQKTEILDHLIKVVGVNLKGFSWIKTRRRFCSRFTDGVSYVGLDCPRSSVYLSFGVRHDRVEEALLKLFPQETARLNPERMTIWKLSVNMGPLSPRWKYPSETTWPILGSDGLALATPEIVAFVKDVAEPYALRHRDPLAIRNTLLFLPGHADGIFLPHDTIFTVDYLERRRDWLDADYQQLSVRYAALAEDAERRPLSHPSSVLVVFARPKLEPVGAKWQDQLGRAYDRVVAGWNS